MLAPAMVDSLVSCAVSFLAGTTLCVCGRPYLQCGSSLIGRAPARSGRVKNVLNSG